MHHFDEACSEDQTVCDDIEGIVAPEVLARQLCHSEEPKTIEYLFKVFHCCTAINSRGIYIYFIALQ